MTSPELAQRAHGQSGPGGRNQVYTEAQWIKPLLTLTKADLATTSSENPTCQQERPTPIPSYGTIPSGNQLATDGRLTISDPFHSRRTSSLSYKERCLFQNLLFLHVKPQLAPLSLTVLCSHVPSEEWASLLVPLLLPHTPTTHNLF